MLLQLESMLRRHLKRISANSDICSHWMCFEPRNAAMLLTRIHYPFLGHLLVGVTGFPWNSKLERVKQQRGNKISNSDFQIRFYRF